MELNFPVQKRPWRCLPCTLPPPYAEAWRVVADGSRKIGEVAAEHSLDRPTLLALVRWHRAHASSSATYLSAGASSVAAAMAATNATSLYTKEMLFYAVQYAAANGVGCRQAARATELHFKLPLNAVPHGTVHQHMKSPRFRFSQAGASRRLPRFEEELVAQHLIQRLEAQTLTKREAAEEMVMLLCRRGRPNPFQACKNGRPSEGFWRGFLQRHPEIQLAKKSHRVVGAE
ncbi:hypothetical protein ACHHYP_20538 [Achlya hypogyna]|uniref:Uncharacterized protein n=1 Tax=Achlya hypogyna TaxID=1202772 RepID=A0A1V9YJF0_ACHHY|nr:hypothetical protein ACHHYP_20538 [Achlya hypogyna]